jgi:serine/threonine-protein kinase
MAWASDELAALSARLDALLALPERQREPWLAAQPDGARLRELLAQEAGGRLATLARPAQDEEEQPWFGMPGERVGPYRLIAPLGRGGMGEVWRAERADGSFEREVALKRPQRPRAGSDAADARLAAQLQFETQVLARLEHRHIARLYDAGLDAQGQPWIASQLVQGERLDAAAAALSATAQLRLLAWVARAVAYAHGRGVLHRDLKPANVLVDANGVPHLLDFGVAALTDGRGAPATGMTPAYAAPEQRAGAPPAVSADVYSLGVIAKRLLDDGRTLPAWQRPDWRAVLARAAAADPAARYASAGELAQEFERLQGGDPVLARPLPASARLLRRARRQPWLFGAGLALTVVLLAGGVASAWQAREAAASAERERAVRDFMAELFRFSPEPGRPAQLHDRSASLIAARFAGQPALQAELYGLVGAGYLQLGAPQQASELFERRIAQLPADAAEAASGRIDLAEAQLDMARLGAAEATLAAFDRGPEPTGESALRLQVLRARLAVERGDFDAAERRLQSLLQAGGRTQAQALGLQAELLVRNSRFDEFTAAFERAAAATEQVEGAGHPAAAHWRSLGARLAAQLGLHAPAQELFDAAQAALRARGGLHQVRAALEASRFWAASYMRLPRPFEEVQAGLQGAVDELRSLGASVPQALHDEAASNLGWLRMEWGDVRGAAMLLGEPLAQRLRAIEQPRERLRWLAVAGWAAALQGRHEAADALLRERLAVRRAAGRGLSIFVATDLYFVAINLAMAGQSEAALRLLDAAPAPAQIEHGQADPRWYGQLLAAARARVLLDAGQPAAALAALPQRAAEAMDAQVTMFNTAPPLLRGEALCAGAGDAKQGLAALREARALLTPAHHADAPVLARLHALMGLCAWQLGQRAEALRLERLAGEALLRQQPVSDYFVAPWRQLQALTRAR